MKTVSESKQIAGWPSDLKKMHGEAQTACWQRHNHARNIAHADYSNPKYIYNRLKADNDWEKESDLIFEGFQKKFGDISARSGLTTNKNLIK